MCLYMLGYNKSHTGSCIVGAVHCKSSKQSIVASYTILYGIRPFRYESHRRTEITATAMHITYTLAIS